MPIYRDPRQGRIPDQPKDRPDVIRPATSSERLYDTFEDYVKTPVIDPLMKLMGLDTPEGQIQALMPTPAAPITPAITMMTKRPMGELLRRLHPTDAIGKAIDPAAFPATMDAVRGVAEQFPRVMSHLQGVAMDLPTITNEYGRLSVPQHVLDWIRQHGVEAWKALQKGEVAKMRLNPKVETAVGQGSAAQTVFHEAGHLGQFIADPYRMHATSRTAQNILGQADNIRYRNPDLAYQWDPIEVASRAIGKRGEQRLAGVARTPYPQAIEEALAPGGLNRDTMQTLWSSARQALEARARQQGVALRPQDARPIDLFSR